MSEKLQILVERKDRRKWRDFTTIPKKIDGEKVVKERKRQFLNLISEKCKTEEVNQNKFYWTDEKLYNRSKK